MQTLDERVEEVENKTDWLEVILERYVAHTDATIRRLELMDKRLEQTIQEMRLGSRQLESTFQETQCDAKAERREWNKRWGELANRLGTIVEDIVAPNMSRIAQELGSGDIEDVMVRRRVRNKKDRTKYREFDVIVVGEDKVILNETKATVRMEYLEDFIQVLSQIEDYLPEYHDKPIVPVFSSLYLTDEVVNYLTRRRIYAMAMGDETMEVLNLEAVRGQA